MSRCCCCCCLVGYFLVKVKTHSRCKDSHIYRETGFQGRAYEREKQDIFGKVFLYSSSLSDFNRKIHIPMQQSWPFVIGKNLPSARAGLLFGYIYYTLRRTPCNYRDDGDSVPSSFSSACGQSRRNRARAWVNSSSPSRHKHLRCMRQSTEIR
jgi:hypothetical protein